MLGEHAESVERGVTEEQHLRAILSDPEVRRRIKELKRRIKEGGPEGPGMTAADLLDVEREQQ